MARQVRKVHEEQTYLLQVGTRPQIANSERITYFSTKISRVNSRPDTIATERKMCLRRTLCTIVQRDQL
eukprot:g56535.t1